MKVVTEYQLVKVEWLVDTNSKTEALRAAKILSDDVVDLSNGPVFIKTQKYEVRDLTSEERCDKVVQDAQNEWENSEKEPVAPPPKKKRGRPATVKTATKRSATKKKSVAEELFGDVL